MHPNDASHVDKGGGRRPPRGHRDPNPLLSERQSQILGLIGAGKTTGEIAADLGLSAATVSSYRKAICRKTGAHSTAGLAAYAVGLGPPQVATAPTPEGAALRRGNLSRSSQPPENRGRDGPSLSQKQRDVLELCAKGLHNAEIGRALGISERTVRGYIGQLFLIFDVSNRTELVGVWLGQAASPDEPR